MHAIKLRSPECCLDDVYFCVLKVSMPDMHYLDCVEPSIHLSYELTNGHASNLKQQLSLFQVICSSQGTFAKPN